MTNFIGNRRGKSIFLCCMKIKMMSLLGIVCVALASCSSGTLVTSSVAYQSVRTTFRQPTEIPDDAEILVVYGFTKTGEIVPVVYNRTSEIMVIDQTMSFFVNSDGQSTSYYDPTVRTTTQTDLSTSTKGASVNLGAIGGALGIGGTLGSILNGVNVGGSGTSGTSTSNTTYFADQPRISLAPKSKGAMSKTFNVSGVGTGSWRRTSAMDTNISANRAGCKFSVCISYSLDGGNTFKKIVTDFFVNSQINVPVTQKGMVNDALRKVYSAKPDALYEPCWLLYFNNNVGGGMDSRVQGLLYDYQ